MNVADAMTPRSALVTVELPGTRDDALEHLQAAEFSSLPVVKQTDDGAEQYRGLVSREDLIEEPDEDQLAMLMEDVPTVQEDASLREVARVVVEEGARRVPVLSDGQLAGIVTVTDVVRAIAEGALDGGVEVAELARSDVNATHEAVPLPAVVQEISLAGVPYALVLDDEGEMSGIVTEVDVLDVAEIVEGAGDTGDSIANEDDEWMWEGIKAVGNRSIPTRNVELPAGPVREFMTPDPVTVSGRRTTREVARTMLSEDVEQVPMVVGDEVAGIVRDVDLLKALL